MDGDIAHRILKNLGEGQSKVLTRDESGQIVVLLSRSIELVEGFRRRHGFVRLAKENVLVGDLFPKLDWRTDEAVSRNNDRLSQCLLEALNWLKKALEEGQAISRNFIETLIVDTANWGILGDEFCLCRMGRTFSWIPKETFEQTASWFLYDAPPRRLTSEFLVIFSLRQTMEVAVRRIIGFQGVDFKARLRHDVIWTILKDHVTAKNFSPPNHISLDQIKHVYDWTEKFIHGMERDYVCVVWKAIMVVDAFFRPTERRNGQMSIYDNFEFSEAELRAMQNEFVEELKKVAKKQHIEKFKIEWMVPDAAIVDGDGQCVKIKPRSQVVECGDS